MKTTRRLVRVCCLLLLTVVAVSCRYAVTSDRVDARHPIGLDTVPIAHVPQLMPRDALTGPVRGEGTRRVVAAADCGFGDDDSNREDSIRTYRPPYKRGTNLVALADTVRLACLPVRDCYSLVMHGERVVIAEWMTQPGESTDSVWVKLAHSEEVQGWVREADMKRDFVPADPVSQFIHAFSHTHLPYFVVVCAVFIALWLVRSLRRREVRQAFMDSLAAVDGVWPLLLCLLTGACATVYQSIQEFAPAVWECYYYAPTLSPLQAPWSIALLLSGVWLAVVVVLATVDDVLRQLSPASALFYLLGLASCCICCYGFFILTVPFYVGYVFLFLLLAAFVRRLYLSLTVPVYRCGRCGNKLRTKGVCPRCGALNV